MKQLIFIGMLLIISVSCYAQEAQKNYTLLLLDFEDRSGVENPLLAFFNETIAFILSRQAGPVQVRMVPTLDRNALLAHAAKTQPDATPLEQGLLAAEWFDADALITGSYTKQGEQWSLESQVYHRREDRKTRQDIQIQGDNFYKLLDEFPAQLLQQFKASYVALTTNSWKAYEEYRRGREAFESYNFLGALQYYDRALELDPTLALVYAEQSYVYFMTGQSDLATKAVEAAQKLLPKASHMEQLAIRALAHAWDAEKGGYREGGWDPAYGVNLLLFPIGQLDREVVADGIVDLAPGGIWDEPLIHQILISACMQEGKRAEAEQHSRRWFEAIQRRIESHPEDVSLLHKTATYCVGIGQYVDRAIDMELKAIELDPKETWAGKRYVLSRLYGVQGNMEKSLEWARQAVQHLPDERLEQRGNPCYDQTWRYLSTLLQERKIPPDKLLRWCEDVLRVPGLPEPYRVRTQYLMAEAYSVMRDAARVDNILVSIGAPHEIDWIVIGPFDTPAEEQFPETPPFALCTNLDKPHAGILDREVQWEPWEDGDPLDGVLWIGPVFNGKYYGGSDHHIPTGDIVYSCIYVEAPTMLEVQVRAGSSMMRVWLGDDPVPVIEVNTLRPAILDTGLSNVSLAAGLNRFLVATLSGTYSFSFCFRITDHDGNAIPGLKYISAKAVLASR